MDAVNVFEFIAAVILALIASSGVWGYIMYRQQRRDRKNDDMKCVKDAVRGILFTDILDAGDKYIERGYITIKQLNNFKKYLYDPYKTLDGDGMADEIWENLSDLSHHE